MKIKKITITIPEDLLKDLKKYCDDNGYKISTYISKLVRDAINK